MYIYNNKCAVSGSKQCNTAIIQTPPTFVEERAAMKMCVHTINFSVSSFIIIKSLNISLYTYDTCIRHRIPATPPANTSRAEPPCRRGSRRAASRPDRTTPASTPPRCSCSLCSPARRCRHQTATRRPSWHQASPQTPLCPRTAGGRFPRAARQTASHGPAATGSGRRPCRRRHPPPPPPPPSRPSSSSPPCAGPTAEGSIGSGEQARPFLPGDLDANLPQKVIAEDRESSLVHCKTIANARSTAVYPATRVTPGTPWV